MVDDTEFIKRRHLSRGRPRKYELNAMGTPDNPTDDSKPGHRSADTDPSVGPSTQPEKRRHSVKGAKKTVHQAMRDPYVQRHPQHPQQQQQRNHPGDPMHFNNSLDCDNMILPPFSMAASSASQAFGSHHLPGNYYLNAHRRNEFDLGLALYHDASGGIDY